MTTDPRPVSPETAPGISRRCGRLVAGTNGETCILDAGHPGDCSWMRRPEAAPPRATAAEPCALCGGWTQNEDGHRDECPTRGTPAHDSDAVMLLVWEQWAKNDGNQGAADLFRRCADRLRASLAAPAPESGALEHTRSCQYWNDTGCTCCLKERAAAQTWFEHYMAWRKRAGEAETLVAALQERATRAETALRFYADPKTWKHPRPNRDRDMLPPSDHDLGIIARAALAPTDREDGR